MLKIKVALLISGKRKSGKNYVTDKLDEILRHKYRTHISGVSLSLKEEYARIHSEKIMLPYVLDLPYEKLLDGPTKEKYRADMIKWGEDMRKKDSGYFCRCTLPDKSKSVDVLIIFDCRRPSDIEFFKQHIQNVVTLRIECTLSERERRGFKFCEGIDDAVSECGLDDFRFDIKINNSGKQDLFECELRRIVEAIEQFV